MRVVADFHIGDMASGRNDRAAPRVSGGRPWLFALFYYLEAKRVAVSSEATMFTGSATLRATG
jgi:hypothetical protein